ncbi:uncharacterized protein LOC125958048 [Anopheles darlingi]|uniref:uncharacterized protein LOC125958048 n=1 Tax=Anopheles darlingi TaxID=43151 RepID=UPI0021001BFF|nr:uncharacterized protein LOC125958048 [Anopheles darlingi]XP_049547113.1 uncharacterized protein LOC125958048 [Anopheles darlingi]
MSLNTFMQMTNSWEAARASLGSNTTGSSNPANSNQHQQQQQQQQQSKQQKYFSPSAVVAAPSGSGGGGGSYNYFDSSFNANATIDRANRRLRRAGYANRSFMYHGEYPGPHEDILAEGFGDMVLSSSGTGRLPYFVEPTYRSLEYDRRQRRRHSVHQLANNINNPSKLDDLRHRFDEYHSSAALPRGAYYGYYTLERNKKLPRPIPNAPLHGGVVYGKPSLFNQSAVRYSGSRSLDRYLVEEEREQPKGPKRGSRSSQGSTDSNNSSHSASSGSLLLTVANLENFAKIHRKSGIAGSSKDGSRTLEKYLASTLDLVPQRGTIGRRSRYNSNILLPHNDEEEEDLDEDGGRVHPADHAAIDYRKDAHQQQSHQHHGTTIVPIDEISIDEGEEVSGHGSEQQLQIAGPSGGASMVSPFRALKGKDPDSVSVASSTHFTMVNGVGPPQRVTKSGICSSGHQITVLIVTMSFVFMIGICAAVFLLEMRAREMPK